MTPRTIIGALAVVAASCSSGSESAPTSTDSPDTTTPAATAAPTSTAAATTAPTAPPTAASTTSPGTTAPVTTTAATESTAAPAGTTPPADLTEEEMVDQEIARTALITLDSFPTGWIEEPSTDDDSAEDDEFENQFDACLGRDDDQRVGDDLERLAVSTGDFRPADDETTSVSHEVVLAPDVDTAITAMGEVSVDGAESCISDVVQRFYQSTFADDPDLIGIKIGEVIVTRTERERPADLAVGVLLEIPLTLDTETVSQYLEVLYQRQGRALSELSFASFGAPFSRDGYTILGDEAVIGIATIGN
ncbi:hypothetical protein [Ilumatobacter sp.]|uniref:hypothetical protein n=1 Tax=Ilumatobacter sp. TaxID=1967498 RepID=UPI003AF6B5A9